MGGRPLDHLLALRRRRRRRRLSQPGGTLFLSFFFSLSSAVFKGRNFCRYFLASFILFASRAVLGSRTLSFFLPTDFVSETKVLDDDGKFVALSVYRSLQRRDGENNRR